MWSSGHCDIRHNYDLWKQSWEKSSGEYVYWLLQSLHMGRKCEWVSKSVLKILVFRVFLEVFSWKTRIFCSKKNYLGMYNYGEIIAHLLTFSAWFVKFFLANPPGSWLVLLLPVSWFLVIWALWNWLQEKSHGECVNWLFTIVLHIGKNGS